ncbi:MAG: ribosome silencing factor [Syntrophorhabdaceae bacterium]|nr:ribosome silencing factor [Syntrophorhabdaceae bacterium]MDD4195639.1 ribosome silencing factor [Syntrophorhabdaceae bacterium]HOC46448.1 ribosome silencing factor [Syntrophorhabdaceae bacterium]
MKPEEELAEILGRLADDKKAVDTVVMDLGGLTDIADYFVIAGGTSERHVRTIADGIREGMKEKQVRPLATEGYEEGRWVILDFQSVIVHIFLASLRELYDLESLWIEAKRYRIKKESKDIEVGNE